VVAVTGARARARAAGVRCEGQGAGPAAGGRARQAARGSAPAAGPGRRPPSAGLRVVLVTTLERGGPIEQSLLLAGGLVARGDDVTVTCANASIAARFSSAGAAVKVVPFRNQADMAAARR